MSEPELNPFASPGSFVTPLPEDELVQPLWPLHATAEATIEDIREQDRGKIYNFRHRIMINVIGLTPALLFFGGLGLMAVGAWQLPENPLEDRWDSAWSLPLLGIGAIGLVAGGILSTFYQLLPEDLYTYGRVRRNFALRPEAIVLAQDDHRFIGITPREKWKVIELDTASDVGLLKLDKAERSIRIEGDYHRYIIPVDALLDCEEECFYHPIDKATQHWLIRLVLNTKSGPVELLFGMSQISLGEPRWNKRRQQLAAAFVQRILALRQSS
ncbi:hypothetical protein AB1L30_17330 [Bremerella sp. JC817]|uniref:hypothetical protein n=1 Tax=Bremerella sp. JC817 TaxID=3231756 RepID=UPI00345AC209